MTLSHWVQVGGRRLGNEASATVTAEEPKEGGRLEQGGAVPSPRAACKPHSPRQPPPPRFRQTPQTKRPGLPLPRALNVLRPALHGGVRQVKSSRGSDHWPARAGLDWQMPAWVAGQGGHACRGWWQEESHTGRLHGRAAGHARLRHSGRTVTLPFWSLLSLFLALQLKLTFF